MRTLLIDNYDSYTFNLFHLLARVNGREPTVVAQDELDVATVNGFDNVVISPGPGRPERPRDFGGSAEAIARSDVPVLGVCLGHQGIGVHAEGEVDHAPEPRHGYVSAIVHDDEEMFAGVPQEFSAVRYHSLRLREPLPEQLKPTAWAEDGVLMAVRHRELPLWGVQFHPESVLSEHGTELVENFNAFTRRVQGPGADGGPDTPATPAVSGQPGGDPLVFRSHVRILDGEIDLDRVARGWFAGEALGCWLDSGGGTGESRWSMLGLAGPCAELVTYRVDDGLRIRRPGGRMETVTGPTLFDHLQDELARRTVLGPELPFDFVGSYVGYFGYELKADLGSTNTHRSSAPDGCWMFADRLVVVDHLSHQTYVVCLTDGDAAGADDAYTWLEETTAFLRHCEHGTAPVPPARRDDRPGRPADDASWRREREGYLRDVETCRQLLRDGESYEICLTTSAQLPDADVDGLTFFRALRRRNPAPYAAYLRLDDVDVVSSSPERFLRIDRDGWVETKPIKGTVGRESDPRRDAQVREAMRVDDKTRAENLMIVDLLRNDLGRVCEVGTVRVPELMVTRSYATVHQLVSTVRGRLRPGTDAVDCVRATFPGGSMTGAPKKRTLEILDSLETGPRGVYSGSIGYLSCTGAADLSIVIRTAVRSGGGCWHVGAGGAIVLDSSPAAEHDEVLLKASAVIDAFHDAAEAGRTCESGEVPR